MKERFDSSTKIQIRTFNIVYLYGADVEVSSSIIGYRERSFLKVNKLRRVVINIINVHNQRYDCCKTCNVDTWL